MPLTLNVQGLDATIVRQQCTRSIPFHQIFCKQATESPSWVHEWKQKYKAHNQEKYKHTPPRRRTLRDRFLQRNCATNSSPSDRSSSTFPGVTNTTDCPQRCSAHNTSWSHVSVQKRTVSPWWHLVGSLHSSHRLGTSLNTKREADSQRTGKIQQSER